MFATVPERVTALQLKLWRRSGGLRGQKHVLGRALLRLPPPPDAASDSDIASAAMSPSPRSGFSGWDASDAAAAAHGPTTRWYRLHSPDARDVDGTEAPLGEVLVSMERRTTAGAQALPSLSDVPARPTPPDAHSPRVEERYLQVDVAKARSLLPADVEKGRDKLTSSDPYAVIKLWPLAAHEPDHPSPLRLPLPRRVPLPLSGGRTMPLLPPLPGLTRPGGPHDDDDEASQSRTRRRTLTVTDSLEPVWNQSFAFDARHVADATHVMITVYDEDARPADPDDYIGEVLVPIPDDADGSDDGSSGSGSKRRGKREEASGEAGGKRTDGVGSSGIVEGWFPLVCSSRHERELRHLLRRLGRPEDLSPPALGEVFCRIRFGPERDVHDAEPAHRPSRRTALGTLALRVLAARDVDTRHHHRACPRYGYCSCVPCLRADASALFITLAAEGSHHHDAALSVHVTFEQQRRRTTEARGATGVVFDADGATFEFRVTEPTGDVALRLMAGDVAIGEALLPLAQLLPLPASPWAELGAVPRAALPAPRWYALVPPRGPGEALLRTRERPEAPLGRICVAARLRLDAPIPFAYLAPEPLPLTAPPGRNEDDAPSVAHLTLATSRLADAMLAPMAAPLRTLLYLQSWQSPRFNALLLALLAAGCTSLAWPLTRRLWPLWLCLAPALHGFVSFLIHRGDAAYVWTDEAEADESASKAASDRARLQRMHWEAEREAARSRGQNMADPNAAMSRNVLVLWRLIQAQIAAAQSSAVWAADALERAANALSWADPHCSAAAVTLLAAAGLAASFGLAVAEVFAPLSPFGLRHVVFAAGATAFLPFPKPTRSMLDYAERMLQLYSPVALGPLTSGAGLEATAALRPGASEAEVRARLRREAQRQQKEEAAEAERSRRERAAARAARLHPGAALRKLLERAPTNARVLHLRLAARLARPAPPAPPGRAPGFRPERE